MLKAVISHNKQTAIVELPMDRLSLQYELSQIGIRRQAKDIPILDEEDQPISVKLFSESDIGQKLGRTVPTVPFAGGCQCVCARCGTRQTGGAV